MKDELLEAKMLVEKWRRHYNRLRLDKSLCCQAPGPEAMEPAAPHLRSLRQPLLAGTGTLT